MDPRHRCTALLAASGLLLLPVDAGACTTVTECTAAVAATQDSRALHALQAIPDPGARLLALHSYLRAGAGLAQRWSWTQAQIEEFAGSAHQLQLSAAVQSVQREFVRGNPGYTLTVNPTVRSLDRQLSAWNSNHSVAAAAREFASAADHYLSSAATAGAAGVDPVAFARFVQDHTPRPSPTLAAPGLSRHGRMYAVDFHVSKGGHIVADTDAASIASVWVAQGWESRLHRAVVSSGAPFTGPLQDPHEPWHYEFALADAAPAPRSAR